MFCEPRSSVELLPCPVFIMMPSTFGAAVISGPPSRSLTVRRMPGHAHLFSRFICQVQSVRSLRYRVLNKNEMGRIFGGKTADGRQTHILARTALGIAGGYTG